MASGHVRSVAQERFDDLGTLFDGRRAGGGKAPRADAM
jgi:hypothetical protein